MGEDVKWDLCSVFMRNPFILLDQKRSLQIVILHMVGLYFVNSFTWVKKFNITKEKSPMKG